MKAEDIRQGKRAREEKKMQQEQINQENRPKIQENQKQQKSFRCPVSQRAKTDKTERHQNKSFIHKEKPDRMITRSGRGTGQTNNARSLANAIGA